MTTATRGKPRIAWDDEARQQLIGALVADALTVLDACAPAPWRVRRAMRSGCWL